VNPSILFSLRPQDGFWFFLLLLSKLGRGPETNFYPVAATPPFFLRVFLTGFPFVGGEGGFLNLPLSSGFPTSVVFLAFFSFPYYPPSSVLARSRRRVHSSLCSLYLSIPPFSPPHRRTLNTSFLSDLSSPFSLFAIFHAAFFPPRTRSCPPPATPILQSFFFCTLDTFNSSFFFRQQPTSCPPFILAPAREEALFCSPRQFRSSLVLFFWPSPVNHTPWSIPPPRTLMCIVTLRHLTPHRVPPP